MKKQLFYSFVVFAATMFSCSKSENSITPIEQGDAQITARASTLGIDAQGKASKAAIEGTEADGLTAIVMSTNTAGDYATGKLHSKGLMTFDATDAAATAVGYTTPADVTGSTKLPVDNTKLYVSAVMPGILADWTFTTPATPTYTFNGTQDLLAAPEFEIMKDHATTPKVATLTFKHLLTKFDIYVSATDQAVIDGWGTIKSITIKSTLGVATFKNVAAVTLKDATADPATAFSGTTVSNWKTYITSTADEEFTGKAIAPTLTSTKIATTMLAPFTAANTVADVVLTITTTKSSKDTATDVAIKLPAGDTQGKSYKISLSFKVTDIKANAAITKWTEVDAGNTDVE